MRLDAEADMRARRGRFTTTGRATTQPVISNATAQVASIQ
jgi:hypothetical protein